MTISSTRIIPSVTVVAKIVDCQLFIRKSTISGTPCLGDATYRIMLDTPSMVVEVSAFVLNGLIPSPDSKRFSPTLENAPQVITALIGKRLMVIMNPETFPGRRLSIKPATSATRYSSLILALGRWFRLPRLRKSSSKDRTKQ